MLRLRYPYISDYYTRAEVDQLVVSSSGSGPVTGSGVFTGDVGTAIYHYLGTPYHFTGIQPAHADLFDIDQISKIGTVYVDLGSQYDTVYNTGGPTSSGIPFVYFSTVSGAGGGSGGSATSLDCAVCDGDNLTVTHTLTAVSGVFTQGIQVGSGTLYMDSDGIDFPDGSRLTSGNIDVSISGTNGIDVYEENDTYIVDGLDEFHAGLSLDLSASPSGNLITNQGYFDNCDFLVSGTATRSGIGDTYMWDLDYGSTIYLKPQHSHETSTATFSSCTDTDGSAAFVIVDTENNLKELFESNHAQGVPKTYKIDLQCDGPAYRSGYIGEVSKSTDTYTISVYSASTGTTRNWHKRGTWSDTDVSWWIYPNYFEVDDGDDQEFAMSLWFSISDPTTDWQYLMGKSTYVSGDDLLRGHFIFVYNTDNQLGYEVNGSAINAGTVLKANTWIHVAVTQDASDRKIFVNGRCIVTGGAAATASALWGLFNIGGNSIRTGNFPPGGMKIAFPRYWKGELSSSEVFRLYEYERKKLGFTPGH